MSQSQSQDRRSTTVPFEVTQLDNGNEKARQEKLLRSLKKIPVCALFCIVSSSFYFMYRVKCSISASSQFSTRHLVVGWIFLCIELGNAITPGILHLLALSSMGKVKCRPLLRLLGQRVPTVDVFITYCGENTDLIMNTVKATLALDYPSDRYRIIVLDDSACVELEKRVESLKTQNSGLHYTSRRSRVVTHSKASNLNHGLSFVHDLPGGPSEYLGVLDVDMIPLPHWLRSVVPHLIDDTRLGLANPPQAMYNIPDHDPLTQTLASMFEVIEPLKDCKDSASCTGTGFIARRYAIDQIGGFPTESMNEEILTSIYLNAIGWRIAYIPENVQYGLVPDSYAAHIKQQTRWCVGLTSMMFVIRAPGTRRMTIKEQCNTMLFSLFLGPPVIVSMLSLIAFPLILSSGDSLILCSNTAQLRKLLLLNLLYYLTIWSFGLFQYLAVDGRLPLFNNASWLSLVPFRFPALLRLFLANLSGRDRPNFTPTASFIDGTLERDTEYSRSLARRLKVILWDCGAIAHLAIVVSCLVGALFSIQSGFRISGSHTSDIKSWTLLEVILVRIGWPSAFFFWSACIAGGWMPISYAMFPPVRLPREKLLVRDPVNGAAYPSDKAKDLERLRCLQYFPVIVTLYLCMTFGFCWWL